MNWNVSDIKKYEMLRRFVVQFINSSQVFTEHMMIAMDPENVPLSEEFVSEIVTDFLDILLDIIYIFNVI